MKKQKSHTHPVTIQRQPEKFFYRLGRREDFQRNIDQAVELGATLTEDKEAGTLKVDWERDTLIKAIAKDSQMWIVSYNEEFYPKS